MTKIVVRKPVIDSCKFPDSQIMTRFRAFLKDEEAEPLRHQAEAFLEVLNGRAVCLEAGTASGKTLAVALPLFEKLERGEVRKIIFLYPTLALMQDQRRVMERLVSIYGLDELSVGTIRGGMSRSSVVSALGKRIVVATPDAVYWFLRKNVKYAHLLIYGLLLADEVVVDEAHLFAGLSAQNLTAFLDRLRALRELYIGDVPKIHVLTATWPEDGTLDGLSPGASHLTGSSLVGDVSLEVLRGDTPLERSQAVARGAVDLLDDGCQKVLMVSNSARGAHMAFNGMTSSGMDARRPEGVPDDFKLSFGTIDAFEVLRVAGEVGLGEEAASKLRRDVALPVRRLKRSTVAGVRGEILAREYGEFLERKVRDLKSELWRAARGGTDSYAGLRAKLSSDSRMVMDELEIGEHTDYSSLKAALEQQAGQAQERTENNLSAEEGEGGVRLTLPGMPELEDMLRGIPFLRDFLRGLQRGLVLDGDSFIDSRELPVEAYRGIKIPIATFMEWFEEEDRNRLRPGVLSKAEHRSIRRIRDREDGALAILYSGSMPRYAREGLIPLFAGLCVPVVLVSTSAVEVGVDFDADGLVTEECSGSSFLQRFGRVGRRGTEARARLFLGRDRYAAFESRIGGHPTVERSDLSEIVRNTLPEPLFLRESRYVHTVQSVVTRQLGEVGEVLPLSAPVEGIMDELRDLEIELAYGLRGTMPGVQLRDGVGKGPFYALRFADAERLFPPESPFELARLDRAFDEIVYISRDDQRDVFVDLRHTWRFVRAMAYVDGAGELRMTSLPEAWLELDGFRETLGRLDTLRNMGRSSPEFLDALGELEGLPLGALKHPKAMLFYGDVVLSWRASKIADSPEPVPYHLRNQWFLLLPSLGDTDTGALLSKHGVENLEELFYDRDGLEHGNGCAGRAIGLVVLEEQAGACLAVWEKIVRG